MIKTLSILPIPILRDNYVWVIINQEKRLAVVVDPGHADPITAYLKAHHLTLSAILITHHHWDHVHGIGDLVKTYQVPVYGPGKENIPGLTQPLRDGMEVMLSHMKLKFTILEIPGHTLGHIAYYAPGILFCGDTLFAGGCGRLFEGTAKQLYTSLKKLSNLPDTTKVYCTHEYTLSNLRFASQVEPHNEHINQRLEDNIQLVSQGAATLPSLLKDERLTNPFLRCDSPEIKASVEKWAGKPLASRLDIFTHLRQWKDAFV
jgi:hydroxyacylglutathione hydrolase